MLFLFQLCDNFKGLEKSNKMVLMMHSGERVLQKIQENKFLGGQEILILATSGLLSSGFFYIFIVLKGSIQCWNVFRASSISSAEMNYSLWAIANRQATAIIGAFFFSWHVVNDFQSMVCVCSGSE